MLDKMLDRFNFTFSRVYTPQIL